MVFTPLLIDLSYFYSITKGDDSFATILLSGTLAEMDLLLKNFEIALKSMDATGIKRIAHSLISLSAIVGMPQVSQWSREIDQLFSDGYFHPEILDLANQIIDGWPSAKSKIENHLVL